MAATLTSGDKAQVASAFFTALAALAALLTVLRAERDRRLALRPRLFLEPISDIPTQEFRLTLVNYGGPAREVAVAGVVAGEFGFYGMVGPTAYWKHGETRHVRLSTPTFANANVNAVIVGRDMRKRHMYAVTAGGASKRWRVAVPWRGSMSHQEVFAHFFPGQRGPLDVPFSPINMTTIDREA